MNACCYKEAFDNLRTTHIEYECSSFEHFESQWYSSWWREVSHFTFWREMEKQRRGRWVIIPICYIKRNASLFSYKGPSLRFQITYSKIGEVFVQKSEVATRQSSKPFSITTYDTYAECSWSNAYLFTYEACGNLRTYTHTNFIRIGSVY